MGLPGLGEKDRATVNLHNALYRNTIRWAKGSLRANKSGYIENPSTSMLWRTRGVAQLQKMGAYFLQLDFCQYGRPYRKRTKFLVWGNAWTDVELMSCTGKGCICSRTGRRHINLSGLQNGRWRSSAAQIYSKEFGQTLSRQLFREKTLSLRGTHPSFVADPSGLWELG